MDTKSTINELFRLAFNHLRKVRPGTLKEIADACECTDRHIGNILRLGRGSTPELKRKIAEYYGTTVDEMVEMGVDIKRQGIPGQAISMRDATRSPAINAQNVGAIQISADDHLSNGEQSGHYEWLTDVEHEVLTLFRKYGNPTLLQRCLGQLRQAEELFG